MSRVIFLHGASSAGKTTLAQAIRAAAEDGFMHLSLDHFRDSGAVDRTHYRDWPAQRPAFFEGYHRAVCGFAKAGNDLIIEHILDDPNWLPQLQRGLARQQVLFVGLHTPLDVLNHREVVRGDRAIGSAAQDFANVHRGLRYDLELDGTAAPDLNALKVLAAMQAQRKPSALFAS